MSSFRSANGLERSIRRQINLANLAIAGAHQIDLAQAEQRIKLWGKQESNRRSFGSATRVTIRDQGWLKTPNISKRPGTSIMDTGVPTVRYCQTLNRSTGQPAQATEICSQILGEKSGIKV